MFAYFDINFAYILPFLDSKCTLCLSCNKFTTFTYYLLCNKSATFSFYISNCAYVKQFSAYNRCPVISNAVNTSSHILYL